jgi:hypothetical protein
VLNSLNSYDFTPVSPQEQFLPPPLPDQDNHQRVILGEICAVVSTDKIREKIWQLEKDCCLLCLRRVYADRSRTPDVNAVDVLDCIDFAILVFPRDSTAREFAFGLIRQNSAIFPFLSILLGMNRLLFVAVEPMEIQFLKLKEDVASIKLQLARLPNDIAMLVRDEIRTALRESEKPSIWSRFKQFFNR